MYTPLNSVTGTLCDVSDLLSRTRKSALKNL